MDEQSQSREIEEVIHWITITALHDERLIAVKGKLLHDLVRDPDAAKLEALGCNKALLLDTLAFAVEMPKLYPPITAADLKDLAKDVESVLHRMKTLTPSVALPFVHDTPDGKQAMTFEPTGGDLHVWPELEEVLQRKAQAYRRLSQLCGQRLVPSHATFQRLAYVWPAVYVASCTGEPHYASVSRLLLFAGITKTPKQLKVAFTDARKQYPHVLHWIEVATEMLQAVSGYVGREK